MHNQIRCEADREYSIGEDELYHFFAFSTQREIRKNEFCFGWMSQQFEDDCHDLARTADTEAYFESVFDTPMDVAMLIKEFYNMHNEQVENEADKIPIPSDNDILRDIGRRIVMEHVTFHLLDPPRKDWEEALTPLHKILF